jgi:hypothetical protein
MKLSLAALLLMALVTCCAAGGRRELAQDATCSRIANW